MKDRYQISFVVEASSFEEAENLAFHAIDLISNLEHENGEGKTFRVVRVVEDLAPLVPVNKARDAGPG